MRKIKTKMGWRRFSTKKEEEEKKKKDWTCLTFCVRLLASMTPLIRT
jgi:hypothetical protein